MTISTKSTCAANSVRAARRGVMSFIGGAIAFTASLCSTAQAQFQQGDLYLVTIAGAQSSPQFPCGGSAVIRVTPSNWSATLVTRLSTLPTHAAYDSFRQGIVVGHDSSAEIVSANGTRTALPSLGGSFARVVMPTGDGRIYMRGSDQSGAIKYLDSANGVHTLRDSGGANSFSLAGIFVVGMFESGTNCLFFASAAAGDLTLITKIPLNAAGDRVQGTVTTTTFTSSPGNTPVPVAMTKGPSGQIFVKVDDNGGALIPRMKLVDPVSLGVVTFASSNYTGVGGETVGAFIPSRNQAFVLDTFSNAFRAFHQNESGPGSVVQTTGVSISTDCGSGESATLLSIEAAPRCPADFDDGSGTGTPDGGVTIDDLLYYLVLYQDGATPADLDDGSGTGVRDGGVTIDDLLFMLAHYAAGC